MSTLPKLRGMRGYKVTAPALRANGCYIGRTHLEVYVAPAVKQPWSELRPLIAAAFAHVKREAFRNETTRQLLPRPLRLYLTTSRRSHWHGRSYSFRKVKVCMGRLHPEPEETTYPHYSNMPVIWHRDWRETLIDFCAHELWHQFSVEPHGRKQEFDCELVASDAIDSYRRRMKYTFTPPVEPEPVELVSNHFVAMSDRAAESINS